MAKRIVPNLMVCLLLILAGSPALAQEPGGAKLLQALKSFLTAENWAYTPVEGKTAVVMDFRGDAMTWRCYAETYEDKEQLIFYSILPFFVPQDKRLAVAEYLSRANYNLIIGNFDLDFEDGEVRYKTSIDVEGGGLTEPMLKNLVYFNVLTMNRFVSGINSIVYGNLTPAQALQTVRAKEEPAKK